MAERDEDLPTAEDVRGILGPAMTPDEQAVERLSHFVRMWDEKPLRGVDDEVYAIHTGTKWEGSLRISDLRAAIAALAHPVSGDVGDLANEVRAIAEDSRYSNEMVGIAVRNWFHRTRIEALARGERM